jgi:hypothetical protein
MKIQFQASVDPDDVADAFILAFLARRQGGAVTPDQVWKSLESRGFVPTDGRPSTTKDADAGAAVAEISERLEKWRSDGLIGGDGAPESITGDRHFWAIGKPLTKG